MSELTFENIFVDAQSLIEDAVSEGRIAAQEVTVTIEQAVGDANYAVVKFEDDDPSVPRWISEGAQDRPAELIGVYGVAFAKRYKQVKEQVKSFEVSQ